MSEILFIQGNEAIARGAIQAGCRYFFGYPITPQSDIPEFMARELPKIGGVFIQSESESGSVYMVYAGGMTGERVMTSTSSPGFSLMQEGISYIAELEIPCVIVEVSRMGPGIGTGGQMGQTDYRQVTKGGGHGAYRNIVLAPASPQECFDLTQLAFYLADNGRGFELETVSAREPTHRGLGLAAMEERGRMLGGTFEISSQPGQGIRVLLSVPIQKEGDSAP